MSNEEYVRSVWVGVSYCSREETNSCCGPTVFIAPFLSGNKWTGAFRAETKDAAFAAAAEFTRKHKEQVRQLREEMDVVAQAMWRCKVGDFIQRVEVWKRVFTRLEAVLATLTRGMRPEALEAR